MASSMYRSTNGIAASGAITTKAFASESATALTNEGSNWASTERPSASSVIASSLNRPLPGLSNSAFKPLAARSALMSANR